MPRKKHGFKREILPDPIYNSPIVTRLINNVMLDGKKGAAQEIIYNAFKKVEEKTGRPALEVFNDALEHVTPQLEIKARRVGGANYQVPMEVRPDRRMTLALRWLTQYSRLRKEKKMEDRLANEIIDASQGQGGAAKKRDDVHKMAEANKAFAHYAY